MKLREAEMYAACVLMRMLNAVVFMEGLGPTCGPIGAAIHWCQPMSQPDKISTPV